MPGWSSDDLAGADFLDRAPDDQRQPLRDAMVGAAGSGETRDFLVAVPSEDGTAWWSTQIHPLAESGQVVGYVAVATDISDLRKLQRDLNQARKMETIGRLAGGVAHDLNNLLTPIRGYAQMMSVALPCDHRLRRNVEGIQKASESATNLIDQLLGFSRSKKPDTADVDLNDIVLGLSGLLRRLIGEDIELVILPRATRGTVRVEPALFEQVVMNLAANARDAMPGGGKLVIQTDTVHSDDELAVGLKAPAGEYVMMAVSDEGTGMSEEDKAHALEAFYTTKEAGAGTGLGLSTCHEIVTRSGGYISLESEPGNGTAVRILLPLAGGKAASSASATENDSWAGVRGTERVLVVDDEQLVRNYVAMVLAEQGYTVMQAATGHEGLRVVEEAGGAGIDLLLTDVVMPLMGGKELAKQLKRVQPNVKVLYTSGYSDELSVHRGLLDSTAAFVQKPFTPATLSFKVREVLGDR